MRITLMSQTPEEVALKVEGWVSGSNVELLEQEGARWLRQVGRLTLDLNGVRFVDEAGVALLRRWPEDRLILRGGSMFIRELLEMGCPSRAFDPASIEGGSS